eukprot:m.84724 g.84724  ORF g.84724 m.84724 type:complete len:90 (-) comp21211_c0_seq3:50-319(-)
MHTALKNYALAYADLKRFLAVAPEDEAELPQTYYDLALVLTRLKPRDISVLPEMTQIIKDAKVRQTTTKEANNMPTRSCSGHPEHNNTK